MSSGTTCLRVTLGQHAQAGRKSVQQDFHGAMLPQGPLRASRGIALALADGISSSNVSQIASAAAVRCFLDDYYGTCEAWSVRRAAQRVLQAANSWLHAQSQRGSARFDMNRGYVCTFSALILKGREGHLLHVGDARIYRLHPQSLEQLTQDHRVVLSATENYLGRALGASATVEIDYCCWPLTAGEVYLLATDGAYEYLDIATIQAALAVHGDDLDACAAALVATALDRGSEDNLTIQLVRIDALPDTSHLPTSSEGLRLPPPALSPRSRLDHYTIVRTLQCSARSHLYLAVDETNGQQVVLKTPSVDLQTETAYLDRLLLEEWIARRIDNVHVIKAAQSGNPRTCLYTALEYVEGHTLAQWIVDHPLPDLDSVRHLVGQIAQGLQALHRKEILHQDLRPENIMIDRHGTVKIIDLGAAHVAGLTEETEQTPTPALLGSVQYTAPEYFVGGTGSPASEVFSLAVITYQMLTGHLPYGLQVTQLRQPSQLHRLRYIGLRTRRPDLPVWLDAVLRRALHPQVHQRHQVPSELVHDLRTPGLRYQQHRAAPLIERNPLLFWQTLSCLLAWTLLVCVALQATSV